jgi:hypothetical protein
MLSNGLYSTRPIRNMSVVRSGRAIARQRHRLHMHAPTAPDATNMPWDRGVRYRYPLIVAKRQDSSCHFSGVQDAIGPIVASSQGRLQVLVTCVRAVALALGDAIEKLQHPLWIGR